MKNLIENAVIMFGIVVAVSIIFDRSLWPMVGYVFLTIAFGGSLIYLIGMRSKKRPMAEYR